MITRQPTWADLGNEGAIATITTATTVLDALEDAFRISAAFNRDDVVPPAVNLWPDEKREWERLLPRLRLRPRHLLTFGSHAPTIRMGLAIWLRCVLTGKLPELPLPTDAIPILYLPGVSRPTLHATDECPLKLRPLAELQYRGVFWSQHNGKDWTVSAFLQSEKGGLNLRLARHTGTQDAFRRSIEKLADIPVGGLEAMSATRSLDGHDFHALPSQSPGRSSPPGTHDSRRSAHTNPTPNMIWKTRAPVA